MLRVLKKILAVIVLIWCIWVIYGIIVGSFGKPLTVGGIARKTQAVVEHIISGTTRRIANIF